MFRGKYSEGEAHSFAELTEIIHALRNKDYGCSWDSVQTNESMKENLTDECEEVLHAIDVKDDDNLCEELGDLLMQVLLHTEVAAERGAFTIEDVIQGVTDKLIRRHPHVFGDVPRPTDPDEAIALWKSIKVKEKERKALIMSEKLAKSFEFRYVKADEGEQVADIEDVCFPPNEACPRNSMLKRVEVLPDFFLVAVDRSSGKIAGFLNGLCTDETAFRDEFFTDLSIHNPTGANVMLCGLDVLPEYQGKGLGREIMRQYLAAEKAKGRKAVYLTCLPRLVHMYEKFGYTDLGVSGSVWGGELWHDMVTELN